MPPTPRRRPRPRSRAIALWVTGAAVVVLTAALLATYLPTSHPGDDDVIKLGSGPTFSMEEFNGDAPAKASLTGEQLPDVTLPALAGSAAAELRLRDLAAGRPLVVNLWSSSCVPCQQETPELVAAWRALQRAGAKVGFVGVDVSDTAAQGRAFLRRFGGTDAYPMLSDPSGEVPYRMGATVLPTTLLVDSHGRVVDSHSGAVSQAKLRSMLEANFGVS